MNFIDYISVFKKKLLLLNFCSSREIQIAIFRRILKLTKKMNSSLNETKFENQSSSYYYYYTVDALFTYHGSTWILDNLNLYLITLVSTLAFILNILSFVVFFDKEFNINLYSYLWVYTANNILTCVLWIFNFTFSTIRILPWTNSYPSQVYYNYIVIPVSVLCYFYNGVLSAIIQRSNWILCEIC